MLIHVTVCDCHAELKGYYYYYYYYTEGSWYHRQELFQTEKSVDEF